MLNITIKVGENQKSRIQASSTQFVPEKKKKNFIRIIRYRVDLIIPADIHFI